VKSHTAWRIDSAALLVSKFYSWLRKSFNIVLYTFLSKAYTVTFPSLYRQVRLLWPCKVLSTKFQFYTEVRVYSAPKGVTRCGPHPPHPLGTPLTTSKQRSRSFILVPIDFSCMTSWRLSIVTFALERTV